MTAGATSPTRKCVLLALCCALAVAGCGDDDAPTDDARETEDSGVVDDVDVPDPCELVTVQDARALFGDGSDAVLAENFLEPLDDEEACTWKEPTGGDAPWAALVVIASPRANAFTLETLDNTEELDIGERAFVRVYNGSLTLEFSQNGTRVTFLYTVSSLGSDVEVDLVAEKDSLIDLARQVADDT